MKKFRCRVARLVAMIMVAGAGLSRAADGPPSYTLQFLGEGSVVALNNADTVAGMVSSPTTGLQTPWAKVAGAARVALPLPAGASSAFPTDLNDAGVVVGVASFPTGRRAVRWIPSGSLYTVELLPLLPGEVASYATGINNLGQIVGARAGILGTPFGFGWLYSDAGGLVGLEAGYGWFATPTDINDRGVILAGTQTMDLATGVVVDVGLAGPSNYNPVSGVALNEAGQIAGAATLRSTSLNVSSVYRFTPGVGWEFIAGSSRYTVATGLNELGDVGWGELGAGIYFEGLGGYALGSLLDPAAAAGWVITGNGCLLNDRRVVATIGRNTATGQAGAVLLTPTGLLPPPAAPTDLTAVPHPATASEPYMAINLSWKNGDVLLTRSYELERRLAGEIAWTSVPLVPPGSSTFHQDTTVVPAMTYEYRVRAVGVAGPGPWSASATATAPDTVLDTKAPTVTILSPANGATVAGIVPVSALATDDSGVELLEISYWNQYLGQEVVLGSAVQAGSLTVNWDTRGLTPDTYAVWAFAHDAVGNWSQTEVLVTVTASAPSVRVTRISLAGKVQGSKATISGQVYVKDANGTAVPNANVTGQWTLPGGSKKSVTGSTDSAGRASFGISGPRGTYTLTVTGVSKAGYRFDASQSVLSKSITK